MVKKRMARFSAEISVHVGIILMLVPKWSVIDKMQLNLRSSLRGPMKWTAHVHLAQVRDVKDQGAFWLMIYFIGNQDRKGCKPFQGLAAYSANNCLSVLHMIFQS